MSTPPGITTMPAASMRFASGGASAAILPSRMQTSRTSPSTPLAGSYTRPLTIRSDDPTGVLPPPPRDAPGLRRRGDRRSDRRNPVPSQQRAHPVANGAQDLFVARVRGLEGRTQRDRHV